MIGFIIGTGRCGTTMLAQMLNSHSKICVPHELQILFENSGNGPRLYEVFQNKENETLKAEDFIDLIEKICPHKFHEYFDYKSFFEKQEYPIYSLKELVNNLYNAIAKSKHKELFLEQTPWYGQRIDILNDTFPNAKYIHVIRDGRDVAISFSRTPWWHNDIGQNLDRWESEVSNIVESSINILNSNQILQVRYEDIIDDAEYELRRICDFLSVKFENTMLDFSKYIDYGLYRKNTLNVSSIAFNEWKKGNKINPVFKGSKYAWKNYLNFDFSMTPNKVQHCLKQFDYETQMSYAYLIKVKVFVLKKYFERVMSLVKLVCYKVFKFLIKLGKCSCSFSKKLFDAKLTTLCPVCVTNSVRFLPLSDFYRENAQQYGYIHFGKAEMTALETYSCANCGASDRERLYTLWIEQQIQKGFLSKSSRVIHFAPESVLSAKLKSLNDFDYKTADLMMEHVDYKVDLLNMPFDDASFDFFICSHVLEHVESDDQAIKELFRITKKGGCGILMAPIIVGLEKTLEDPSIKDEAGRWKHFGQDDHVRLYAHNDYVNKISSHGFSVEELGIEYFGEKTFRALGLKSTSILYVVRK